VQFVSRAISEKLHAWLEARFGAIRLAALVR
jgi:hypothetical protein